MNALSDALDEFAASPRRPWVWALPMAGLPPGAAAQCLRLLDGDERDRASRFHFERDVALYAAAHALLRWSLSVRHGGAPGAWRFTADGLGRPSLSQHGASMPPRFSLTHTQGLVAVALAADGDIGVDAEDIGADKDLAAIAPACFSAAECRQLASGHPRFVSLPERFHAFWTLKEALLKAKGLGLTQHPATFTIDLHSMTARVPPPLAPALAWHLECRRPTARHLLSVAVDGRDVNVGWSLIGDADAWLAHAGSLAQAR